MVLWYYTCGLQNNLSTSVCHGAFSRRLWCCPLLHRRTIVAHNGSCLHCRDSVFQSWHFLEATLRWEAHRTYVCANYTRIHLKCERPSLQTSQQPSSTRANTQQIQQDVLCFCWFSCLFFKCTELWDKIMSATTRQTHQERFYWPCVSCGKMLVMWWLFICASI